MTDETNLFVPRDESGANMTTAAPHLFALAQVRQAPRQPRSRASSSLFQLYSRRECVGQVAYFGPN